MSVNLSPRQLDEPGFTGTVGAILAATDADALIQGHLPWRPGE